jgi:hypothetical protein
MSKNFIYESFEDYLNYVLLIESEEGCKECNEKSILEAGAPAGKPDPWEFQFSSGKYKASDVNAAQKKALENDFLKRVVPVLDDPRFTGQKLKISVEAASSKVPIKAGGTLAQELKKSGYSEDNKGLCDARAKTVTDLIGDIIFKKYAPKGMDKAKYLKSLGSKVVFAGVSKPDIGPDYDPGTDDPKDMKYKENQYISALLEPLGGKIRDDLKIKCNNDTRFEGGEATEANGFKGYNKTVFIDAKSGTIMKIKFDPKTIPDSILFSYFGQHKLSPFSGSVGAKMAFPWSEKTEEDMKNRYKQSGNAKVYTVENLGGTKYIVHDYKRTLNEIINKGGKLVASIESTLKSIGLPPIKEICPDFFDSSGKIQVYSNRSTEEASKSEALALTADLIKRGFIKESPMVGKTSTSILVTKNIASDSVTLVAFSPVSGTVFNIITTCTPPPEA